MIKYWYFNHSQILHMLSLKNLYWFVKKIKLTYSLKMFEIIIN